MSNAFLSTFRILLVSQEMGSHYRKQNSLQGREKGVCVCVFTNEAVFLSCGSVNFRFQLCCKLEPISILFLGEEVPGVIHKLGFLPHPTYLRVSP